MENVRVYVRVNSGTRQGATPETDCDQAECLKVRMVRDTI